MEQTKAIDEDWERNDLRLLYDPLDVIKNLRDEIWPVVPGVEEKKGVAALINLLRHIYSLMPPKWWEAEGESPEHDIDNPILKYAWQKLPLDPNRYRYATNHAFGLLQYHEHHNYPHAMYDTLFDIYSRRLMGTTWWYRDGLARWYGSWASVRSKGTTQPWVTEPTEYNTTRNTWFKWEVDELPTMTPYRLNGVWLEGRFEKFIHFLNPLFLRIRWKSAGGQQGLRFPQLENLMVKRVDGALIGKPEFDYVRYRLVVVIKAWNKQGKEDRLYRFDQFGRPINPPVQHKNPELGIDAVDLFSEAGNYELVYLNVNDNPSFIIDESSEIEDAQEDTIDTTDADSTDEQNSREDQDLFGDSSDIPEPIPNRPNPQQRKRRRGSGADSNKGGSMADRVRELEAALSDSQKRGDEVHKQLEAISARLKDARAENAKYRDEVHAVADRRVEVQEQRDSLHNELEGIRGLLKTAETQRAKDLEEIRVTVSQRDEAQKQRDDLLKERNDIREWGDLLSEQLTATREQLDNALKDEATKRLIDMQKERDDYERALRDLEKKHKKAKKVLSRIGGSVNDFMAWDPEVIEVKEEPKN